MYHSESLFSGLSPTRGEPMNLGASSPGGSPSSPMSGGQYLPSFLIGGSASSTPFVWPGSPGKSHQRSFTVSPPSPMQQGLSHTPVSGQGMPYQTPKGYVGRLASDKPSGPPVLGLVESIHSPAVLSQQTPNMESFGSSTPLSTRPGPPSFHSQSLFGETKHMTMSPAQLDPFYTQRDALSINDQLDETWVTVFGFPPAAASYILQQFSQYGTIVEHKLEPNGNWVHLHYQSKLQAKKAISKNGKVLGGSIMIGVKPCIEKGLMDESTKENSVLTVGLASSPVRTMSSDWGEDSRRETGSERSIGNMRPLTQAYRVSASERDVSSPQRTPQKNNNVFARTMDYMFGW